MIAKAKTIAADLKANLHEGVYAGVTGPTFETRSEYSCYILWGKMLLHEHCSGSAIVAC
jgi:purine nucleoside phosphorylase